MARVILICGKIASGKTFYRQRLMERSPAVCSTPLVCLSIDELTIPMGELGALHDQVCAAAQGYLLARAAEIARAGVDVILDWGFWTKAWRQEASRFFRDRGIAAEWHYIHVSQARWQANIQKRNAAVLAGESSDYFVDEGLKQKLLAAFEEPGREEIDVWFELA